MKRNLTIQLDEAIIEKARVVAAKRSISISRLISEEIERIAAKENSWQVAKRKALIQLNHPFHLGGKALPPRQDFHTR